MKVLRIIHTLDPEAGGPIEGLNQSKLIHDKMGISTEVMTVDDPAGSYLKKYRDSGWKIYPLGPGKYGWGYHRSIYSWLKMNADGYDAVIVHGLWLYPSYVAWKVLHKTKIPWFVFPHGMLDPWFQSWSRRPLKTLRNIIYWKLIEHKVVRDASAVLFTSEQEKKLAEKSFRPYQGKAKVIPYGTKSIPDYTPSARKAFMSRCPAVKDMPYLLCLSRIDPKKGIDLLIDAYIRWADTVGNKKLLLVIAGPITNQAYGRALKKKVEHFHKKKKEELILFPGMLAGEEKWGSYHQAEAFILPSHQENFGIVVAEAMSCGKVVLMSDKINIWREIVEANSGLVEPDNEEGAFNLIQRWMKIDLDERRRMELNAKMCFEQHFEITQSAKMLARLINSKTTS